MTPFYILFAMTHRRSLVEAGDGQYRVGCECGSITGAMSRTSAELLSAHPCEIEGLSQTFREQWASVERAKAAKAA